MDRNGFRGERLKNARLFRGITLSELAERTGISKQSISQYENGSRPDIERVITMARELDFPPEYFLQEDSRKTVTEVTYFRSLATATKMSRTSQSIKLEYVAKMFKILAQYVSFPVLNLPEVEFTGSDDEFDDAGQKAMQEEIEAIALKVREHWNLDLAPIKDLQMTLEENGVIVTGFDTKDGKIDAFSQRTLIDDGDVFFIAVALGEKPKGRIFFDMAHELGHILLHPWSESLDLISKEDFKMRETQANMFASAFLLPRESFLREIQAYPTDLNYYLHLKKRWNCSMQAMIYRAHQLGAVTDNQYQYMMRQVSKKGWRTKEPGDTPYCLNENIFQGAIDVLFEAEYLNPATLLRLFKKYGVTLYTQDIEELLHLRKDTLKVESDSPRIIQLKRPAMEVDDAESKKQKE